MFFNNVPDSLPRDAVTPSLARLADASKYPCGADARSVRPLINYLLYPDRNWDSPNVSTLPNKIHDGPMFIAPLEVSKIEPSYFTPT